MFLFPFIMYQVWISALRDDTSGLPLLSMPSPQLKGPLLPTLMALSIDLVKLFFGVM